MSAEVILRQELPDTKPPKNLEESIDQMRANLVGMVRPLLAVDDLGAAAKVIQCAELLKHLADEIEFDGNASYDIGWPLVVEKDEVNSYLTGPDE